MAAKPTPVSLTTPVAPPLDVAPASEAERLAELSPALLSTTDGSGRLAFVSGAWERLLGWEPSDLVGCLAAELVHPEDLPMLQAAVEPVKAANGARHGVEVRMATRDGDWRWISWHMHFDSGRCYAAGLDATDRHVAERALEASEGRYRALMAQVPAIVYTAGMGADATWEYVSPQIEALLGYSAGEWLADRSLWFDAIHPDDRERVLAEELSLAEPGSQQPTEYRMRRRDGEWICVRDDATVIVKADGELAFQGVLVDITEAKRAEQAVRDKHDQLQAIIDNSPLVIFAKDTEYRYTLANRETDELFGAPAEGLIGRDDFAFVSAEEAAALRAADSQVLESGAAVEVEETVTVNGRRRIFLSHKFPLRSGDGTVYGLCGIATDITERVAREDALHAKVEWSFRIRDAIERDRLVLYAQPIVEVATGRVVQEELLVRMLSERGDELIMPSEFLPPAERFGLITAIDRWVVARAALMARDRRVEVNLSGQSLGDTELPAYIEEQILAAGADPSHLVFEITETAAAEDLDQARRLAERLTALGCGFALDDFGTGYGSFTYLKHLPVNYIKIDMDFVRELGAGGADRQVVKAIVDVARTFGIQTIAEGVESRETLAVLGEMGVDYAQGFFVGFPAATS
jgi:PAS domain S-box-containing protein